jgi:CAAX prenyl protease-like protein
LAQADRTTILRGMNLLREQLAKSPERARAVPYVVILALTFLQDSGGESFRYWMYFIKMLVGIWCIREMRAFVPELRWAFSWEAVVVGVLVCVAWVGLDAYYRHFEFLFSKGKPWNPFAQFPKEPALAWFFVAVRTFGSALVIPPLEEAFFRSFLYRYMVRIDFLNLPLRHFHWLSFVVTALIFGFMHYQWLPGILCGMAYQWLVIRKDRLGDAMTAHAITNFLLGVWAVWQNDWRFW